jgi:hypothetical protein
VSSAPDTATPGTATFLFADIADLCRAVTAHLPASGDTQVKSYLPPRSNFRPRGPVLIEAFSSGERASIGEPRLVAA